MLDRHGSIAPKMSSVCLRVAGGEGASRFRSAAAFFELALSHALSRAAAALSATRPLSLRDLYLMTFHLLITRPSPTIAFSLCTFLLTALFPLGKTPARSTSLSLHHAHDPSRPPHRYPALPTSFSHPEHTPSFAPPSI